MKGQFAGLLHNVGFVHSPDPKHPSSNVNSENVKLVKAVLCSGLYPNVIKVEQKNPDKLVPSCSLVTEFVYLTVVSTCRPPKLLTKDGRVNFHPKSVNSDEKYFESKFLIYHTKVKSSQVYVHDATMIPPFPLLFFGGDITVQRDGDQETIAVDQWIIFQAPKQHAKLVKVRVATKL